MIDFATNPMSTAATPTSTQSTVCIGRALGIGIPAAVERGADAALHFAHRPTGGKFARGEL